MYFHCTNYHYIIHYTNEQSIEGHLADLVDFCISIIFVYTYVYLCTYVINVRNNCALVLFSSFISFISSFFYFDFQTHAFNGNRQL